MHRALTALAVAAVLAAGWGAPAHGDEADARVIGIADGARIAALFAPYEVGAPVGAGWYLAGIRIPASSIEVTLVTRTGREAMLRLLPPDPEGGGEHTTNFRIRRSLPLVQGGGKEAADLLVEALRANDEESLWVDPKKGVLSRRGERLRELDAGIRSPSEKARVAAARADRESEELLEWDREADPDALTEADLVRTPGYLERICQGLRARRLLYTGMAGDLDCWGRISLAIRIGVSEGLLPYLVLLAAFAAWVAGRIRRAPIRRVAAAAVTAAGLGLFPFLDEPGRVPRNVMVILSDGIVVILMITGALAALTARRLRGRPPRVWWWLAGILAVSALLGGSCRSPR